MRPATPAFEAAIRVGHAERQERAIDDAGLTIDAPGSVVTTKQRGDGTASCQAPRTGPIYDATVGEDRQDLPGVIFQAVTTRATSKPGPSRAGASLAPALARYALTSCSSRAFRDCAALPDRLDAVPTVGKPSAAVYEPSQRLGRLRRAVLLLVRESLDPWPGVGKTHLAVGLGLARADIVPGRVEDVVDLRPTRLRTYYPGLVPRARFTG